MANDQPPERTRITARDLAKGFSLDTGKEHPFVLRSFQTYVLDVEDTHFHLDSAVLLPDFSADDPTADTNDANRVTGLVALCAVYQHAEAHPQQAALVVGHSDRNGPEKYNLELSELRAANVLALLEGNRQMWVDICQRKHRVEDYQTILKWVHRTFTNDAEDWEDCDPGTVDNVLGPRTRGATKVFQREYNDGALVDLPPDIGASVTVNGAVGPETWGAFFDVYMRVLERLLLTDSDGLGARRESLKFVDPPKTVGCGEYHPLTDNVVDNRISQIDRRVEILFFDQGQEPRLDCHPSPGVCNKDACELYDPRCYLGRPIELKPVPVLDLQHRDFPVFPVIEQSSNTDVCWIVSIGMMIAWETEPKEKWNGIRSGRGRDEYLIGLLDVIYDGRLKRLYRHGRGYSGGVSGLVSEVNKYAGELRLDRRLVPVERETPLNMTWEDIRRHYHSQNQKGEYSPLLFVPVAASSHSSVIVEYSLHSEGDYFDHIDREGSIRQSNVSDERLRVRPSQAYYWKLPPERNANE